MVGIQSTSYNVVNYGAHGNGESDDSQVYISFSSTLLSSPILFILYTSLKISMFYFFIFFIGNKSIHIKLEMFKHIQNNT